MPYYVRVFCRSERIPCLAEVEKELLVTWPTARLVSEDARDSVTWEMVEFHYSETQSPILVELSVNDGADSLASEESEEFIEEIGDVSGQEARARVVEHLRGVNFIVCCQLPFDISERGYEATDQLLNFFVNNYDGMSQADGEGFYEGANLVVAMD